MGRNVKSQARNLAGRMLHCSFSFVAAKRRKAAVQETAQQTAENCK
jgi:hypothetical protein